MASSSSVPGQRAREVAKTVAWAEGSARVVNDGSEADLFRAVRQVQPNVSAAPVFYVDPCKIPYKGKFWCHLMTTGTQADLVAFATRIGLNIRWIQKAGTDLVHFDLTDVKRGEAIRAGAVPASSATMFRACVISKRQGQTAGNAAELAEGLEELNADKKEEV